MRSTISGNGRSSKQVFVGISLFLGFLAKKNNLKTPLIVINIKERFVSNSFQTRSSVKFGESLQ